MRLLLSALLLSTVACGSTVTDLHADAASTDVASTDSAGPVACAPHRAPCRVTLTCQDLTRCEAVDLPTGRVTPVDLGVIPRPGDVRVEIGRYLILSAASNVCRFGPTPGTHSAPFAALSDIPTAPTACAWDMGPNLLCGVNTASYTPSCVGAGLLVRDAAGQLYRLRVVGDRAAASGWQMEIEWLAIDG